MVSDVERCKILDEFAQKLYNSGYKLIQIRRIILAGIKGYKKMKGWQEMEEEGFTELLERAAPEELPRNSLKRVNGSERKIRMKTPLSGSQGRKRKQNIY